MGRDFRAADVKRCYACGNWDGDRTVYEADRKIKVDDREEANCRFFHVKKAGSDSCDQFVRAF